MFTPRGCIRLERFWGTAKLQGLRIASAGWKCVDLVHWVASLVKVPLPAFNTRIAVVQFFFFFGGGGGGGGSFQFCFVLVFWLIFVKEKHLFLVGGTEISGECYFQLRGFKLISIFWLKKKWDQIGQHVFFFSGGFCFKTQTGTFSHFRIRALSSLHASNWNSQLYVKHTHTHTNSKFLKKKQPHSSLFFPHTRFPQPKLAAWSIASKPSRRSWRLSGASVDEAQTASVFFGLVFTFIIIYSL